MIKNQLNINKMSTSAATTFVETEGRNACALIDDVKGAGQNGFTCLLLPSMGDLKEEFRFLKKELMESSNVSRVISADLRGMGESGVGFSSYEIHDTGSDIVKIVRSLNLQRVVVVGCSMSAAAAIYAGSEEHDRIVGLVLVGPFAWDHPMPFGVPTLLSMLLTTWTGPAFWVSYYKSLYTLKPSPVPDLETYSQHLRSNLREKGRIRALRRHVFGSKSVCASKIPELASRRLPISVVFGTKDPDFSKGIDAEIKEFKERLPHIWSFKKIEGAGHYPHVECPREVSQFIQDFLMQI